jgi:hypothetical protein
MLKKILPTAFLVSCLLITSALAWTAPTGTPDDSDAFAPINVSGADQGKLGGLGIGVDGASLLRAFTGFIAGGVSGNYAVEKTNFQTAGLKAQVLGNFAADKYCKPDGTGCRTLDELGAGGGGGGTYVGVTTNSYTGARGGYAAANALCVAEVAGSNRVCTSADFANGLPPAGATGIGWYNGFNSGLNDSVNNYTANDCTSWNSAASNYTGSLWSSGPAYNTCNNARKFLCCKSGSTGGGGGGGVTSVATGNGLTGGPITTTGTVSVDASSLVTCGTAITGKVWWNGTKFVCGTDNAISGGAVTSVATGNGLTGGPITTTGTVSVTAPSCSGSTQKLLWNGTAFTCGTDNDTGSSSGDISSVTAGIGLAGGGTSGAVTLNLANPAKGCSTGMVMTSFDLSSGSPATCQIPVDTHSFSCVNKNTTVNGGSGSLNCDAGYLATGGGVQCVSPANDYVANSTPTATNGWSGSCRNRTTGALAADGFVNVSVRCCKLNL